MDSISRRPSLVFRKVFIIIALVGHFHSAHSQTRTIDGKDFTRYKPGYFKQKNPLSYQLFLSPILTVDPLGIGGKSTYAIGGGSNLTLWESKSKETGLQGLKFKTLFMTVAYEYYPQQYDKLYLGFGIRIKTFMPIMARMERIIDIGDFVGSSARFCFGFEVKKVTLFLCGVTGFSYPHPDTGNKYANSGAVMLIIPVFQNHNR